MKIRLQRHAHFAEQGQLNTENNTLSVFTDIKPDSEISKYPLSGKFDVFNETVVCLFKINNELRLMVNSEVFSLTDILVSYKKDYDLAKLIISKGSKNFQIEYDLKNMYTVSTLTYSEEEEDVNFGLWLFNIINSDERKNILLQNW